MSTCCKTCPENKKVMLLRQLYVKGLSLSFLDESQRSLHALFKLHDRRDIV